MKKILIALLVLLALAAVLLPAGVGLLIQSRAQASLGEDMPEASIDWRRGWTRSTVDVEAREWRAALRFRHTPLSPPGWLAGEGRVTLFEPPVAIDVRGRVTPGFGLTGQAQAPSVRFDGPVGWTIGQPRIEAEVQRAGAFRLAVEIAETLGADGLGNRLALAGGGLNVDIDPVDERYSRALISLRATRADQPSSHLRVRISRIDREALVTLRQSLGYLSDAEPNSADASLATVGVVSAWGELAAAGIRIELESLALDGDLTMDGAWTPATRQFSLHGGGPARIALDWTAAVIGLDRVIAPGEARAEAEALLDELTQQDGISVEGGAIVVRIGPPRN